MKYLVPVLLGVLLGGSVYAYETWRDPATEIWWHYTVVDGNARIDGAHFFYNDGPGPIRGDVTIPSSIKGYPIVSIWANAFEGADMESVIIPSGVVTVGSSAFANCAALKSVDIPSSVTKIGGAAFSGCISLKAVYITDLSAWCRIVFGSVANPLYYAKQLFLNGKKITNLRIPTDIAKIGDYAFEGCDVNSIEWSYSISSIGNSAFAYCDNLTTVTIPEGVVDIGHLAFEHCKSLKSVSIASTVTSIGSSTFASCESLTKINVPAKVVSIGDYAFWHCKQLYSISIPSSVTSIGRWMLRDTACYNSHADGLIVKDGWVLDVKGTCPTDITIPEGSRGIAAYVFDGSSGIRSVTIPASVRYVGEYAFTGCKALKAVYAGDVSSWCKVDFGNSEANPLCFAKRLYCNGIEVEDLHIPDDINEIKKRTFINCTSIRTLSFSSCVTNIGDSAFFGCTTLSELTIPGTIKTIEWSAFDGCSGITSLTLQDGAERILGRAFYCNKLKAVSLPASVKYIDKNAFSGCYSISSVQIPSCVTNVFEMFGGQFAKKGMKEVRLCDGVKEVANELCKGFEALETVIIPNSVTKIGAYAFYGCQNLTSATIPSGVTSIGDYAFYCCGRLAPIDFPSGLTYLGEYAFYSCLGLTSVSIPSGLTKISRGVFGSCENLSSVTIPYGIESIESAAFSLCAQLVSISIPESVKYIGGSAFSGTRMIDDSPDGFVIVDDCLIKFKGVCPSEITIPDGVRVIGGNAFMGCSDLVSVNIPEGVVSIGDWAFYGCEKLTSVTMPNSIEIVGERSFACCDALVAIALPPNLTDIEYWTFYFCKNLTTVTIPPSVKQIVTGAFDYCDKLSTIIVSKGDYSRVRTMLESAGVAVGKLTFLQIEIPTPPKFVPEDGTVFDVSLKVSITSEVANATIYYTRDGSTPTTNSTVFTKKFTIDRRTTVKAIACANGYASQIATATYAKGRAATPVITSRDAEFRFSGNLITISSTEADAEIHFTTNGATPTASSPLYEGPFEISDTTTINAIAIGDQDLFDSAVASETFVREWVRVADPTSNPESGTVFSHRGQSVALSCEEGATIYYTLDGSVPSHGSMQYTGPFEVDDTTTIKMLACRNDYADSEIVTVKLIREWLVVDSPTSVPSSGTKFYHRGQEVVLSAIEGATIYYTLDGSYPTLASSKYTGPFTIDESTLVKMIAVKDDYEDSGLVVVDLQREWIKLGKPVCSPENGTKFRQNGQVVTLSCEDGATIYYTINGGTPTDKSQRYSEPFSIDETTTIRMIAVKDDFADSDVAVVTLVRERDTVAAPTCEPPDGTVFTHSGQLVTLSCEEGASIYYKFSWDRPTRYSNLYTGPFTIDETTIISMIAVKDDCNDSEVVTVRLKREWEKVKQPICSAEDGSAFFHKGKEISLSCEDGAEIHYTLDGSQPTATSKRYDKPFTIDDTTVIKMMAVRDDYADSDIVTVTLVRDWEVTPSPTSNPKSGTVFFHNGQNVALHCVDGASIFYTLDGSEPTVESEKYEGPFTIDATTLVRMIAVADDYKESAAVDVSLTREWESVGAPTIEAYKGQIRDGYKTDVLEGAYLLVKMSCATDGATIYYTTDGSDPSVKSFLYVKPFKVFGSLPIRAIAMKEDFADSPIASKSIVKNWRIGDSLNFPDLEFECSGTADWVKDDAVSHDGVASMRSGAIDDNENSILKVRVKGSGKVVFWMKASCEETDLQPYWWDHGAFCVDGQEKVVVEGLADWTKFTVPVDGSGEHELSWAYIKDEADKENADCVWVDQVLWIADDWTTATWTGDADIPLKWLDEYGLIKDADPEIVIAQKTGKVDGAGNGLTFADEFVAGTNPTDPGSKFVVRIKMIDDKPVVTWEPALNGDGIKTGVRTYTIQGSNDLKEWCDVPDGKESEYHYFKASVSMP